MLAVPGSIPTDPNWAFEFKWDGVRAVVYIDGDVHAFSRNDRDVTISYPEVGDLAAALGGVPAVLDGELVAFDTTGRPDFGTLQRRMHVVDRAAVRTLVTEVPVVFVVFDLLRLDGQSLLKQPYDQRRELLESLDLDAGACRTAPVFYESGADVLAVSRAQGMEGVVAKRRDSVYEAGRRSTAWRKVKHVRTQEVVIGGWKDGQGGRSGRIGSLMMGIPDADGLRYIGQVGTGFTEAMLADLAGRLSALARPTSPFAGRVPVEVGRAGHWAEPVLVGEVAFNEWTDDGILRHPAWRGLRPDKHPGDVRLE